MPLQILQLRPSIQKPKVSFFLTLPRRYCKAVRLWWWIPIKNADLLGIGELNAYNLQSFKSKMCVIYIYTHNYHRYTTKKCVFAGEELHGSWCFLMLLAWWSPRYEFSVSRFMPTQTQCPSLAAACGWDPACKLGTAPTQEPMHINTICIYKYII